VNATRPNAKLVGVLTTCAFENTQPRFQWSSSKYTRVVSLSAKSEGLVSAVSWQSRGEWRLAVSVERASCCVGPSVAVCVAVCERLRREVWRVRPVPGPRARGPSHGDRAVARSRVLASPLCACSCCSCAARRDHMHVRSGSRARSDGDTGGKSEGTEAGRMCTQGVSSSPACGAGCRGLLACS
jgi:hypothetical protein